MPLYWRTTYSTCCVIHCRNSEFRQRHRSFRTVVSQQLPISGLLGYCNIHLLEDAPGTHRLLEIGHEVKCSDDVAVLHLGHSAQAGRSHSARRVDGRQGARPAGVSGNICTMTPRGVNSSNAIISSSKNQLDTTCPPQQPSLPKVLQRHCPNGFPAHLSLQSRPSMSPGRNTSFSTALPVLSWGPICHGLQPQPAPFSLLSHQDLVRL